MSIENSLNDLKQLKLISSDELTKTSDISPYSYQASKMFDNLK
jgi:hypothetical protein